MFKQKYIIIRNPNSTMALVIEDGVVVKATQRGYIAETEASALLVAASTMRWWNPEIKDNDYPEIIEG